MTKKLIDRDKTFEMYYALGTSRSLPILHKKMSRKWKTGVPSERTLKDWSQKYNWRNRVILRDNAVREGVEEGALEAVVGHRVKEIEHLDRAMSEIDAVMQLIFDALQSATHIDPKTGKHRRYGCPVQCTIPVRDGESEVG